MSFNINFNFDNILLNFNCFRRKGDDDLSLEIVDDIEDHPFPLEINKTFYILLDKNHVCIQATKSYLFKINGKNTTGKKLDAIFPKYMSDFYQYIAEQVIETREEVRYRVKINLIYHEILGIPIFNHVEGEPVVAIFKVPYSKIQKPYIKDKQSKTVQYVINRAGDILEIKTKKAWDHFLSKNGRNKEFMSNKCIGKNIFTDVIKGESVIKIYRQLFDIVLHENIRKRTVSFGWFCDGSSIERQMIMNIERIGENLKITSTLVKETVVYQISDYLDYPVSQTNEPEESVFSVCSFCKRIQVSIYDKDRKHLEKYTRVNPKSPSHYVPGTDIVNIGKKAKGGYSLPPNNIMNAWIGPEQWKKIKTRYPDSFIVHDICEICKDEWENYFERIRN